MDNRFTKDIQVMAIRNARRSPARTPRPAPAPHKILDLGAGPLDRVRLNIVTARPSAGCRPTCLAGTGEFRRANSGFVRRGEVAGFGGGMHGYAALEGTFLGGCLFSAVRRAARPPARRRS